MSGCIRKVTPLLLLCLSWTAGLTGCAGLVPYNAPVKPPRGALFINFKAPLTTNVNRTPCDPGLLRTSHEENAFFWEFIFTGLTFSWDDAGIAQIAQSAGIEQVAYADYEVMNILGIYAEFTVHVYGQGEEGASP